MQKNPSVLLVVAASLFDNAGRILMQLRHHDSAHGGLWEFPGGKVEAGETIVSALVRELEEELGIVVEPGDLQPLSFACGEDESAQRSIVILLYTCRKWQGEPQCRVASRLQWFQPDQLAALPMPPLDISLAKAITETI